MKIRNSSELRLAIQDLERREMMQREEMNVHVKKIMNDLKPRNLVRNSIRTIIRTPELRSKLGDIALGIGTGYLTKGLIPRKGNSIVRSLLRKSVQAGVTGVVTKNAYKAKAIVQAVLKNIFPGKQRFTTS